MVRAIKIVFVLCEKQFARLDVAGNDAVPKRENFSLKSPKISTGSFSEVFKVYILEASALWQCYRSDKWTCDGMFSDLVVLYDDNSQGYYTLKT